MTTDPNSRKSHFVLSGVTETESFISRGMGRRPVVPDRDRNQHSLELRGQLSEVETYSEVAVASQLQAGMEDGLGISLEFESFPGVELAFESLARENSGMSYSTSSIAEWMTILKLLRRQCLYRTENSVISRD